MFLVKGFSILQVKGAHICRCGATRGEITLHFPPRFAAQRSLCSSTLLLTHMTEWRRNRSGRNGFAATPFSPQINNHNL